MRKKYNQIGRSMVEMLGVLAIIGVLSVGGIAGYSKAMEKHKMNSFIESIRELMYSIDTELYQKNIGVGAQLSPAVRIFEKLNLIPNNMKVVNDSTIVFLPYKSNVQILFSDNGNYIRITASNLPPDLCANFFLSVSDWGDDNMLWTGVIMNPNNPDGVHWRDNAIYYPGGNINHFGNAQKIMEVCEQNEHDDSGIMIERYFRK
ncbi:MAG: hypothetical protein IJ019_06235 [Alphaproteobacteria bacterium]|nr:hypothetical protein [Alphaproteobacteria bacterium]